MCTQIIDDYRIISTKQLVRAIREVNNCSERFCFILGSGASVSSGIPAGSELERRWMEEMEHEPGFEEVRLIADKLKFGNHLEYNFHEIEEAWKSTGTPGIRSASSHNFVKAGCGSHYLYSSPRSSS